MHIDMAIMKNLGKAFLPKNITVKFCPKCGSYNIHYTFGKSKKLGLFGQFFGNRMMCFDCGYSGLFPVKKVELKKK
jgi:hypothetical protein